MRDAGIPFRNLTVAQVDRIVARLRRARPGEVVFARELDIAPAELAEFLDRNRGILGRGIVVVEA